MDLMYGILFQKKMNIFACFPKSLASGAKILGIHSLAII